MQHNEKNWQSPDHRGETENHRVGRELYHRDQQNNQPAHGSTWDNGNHFHTGYSNQTRSHFPEDTHQRTTNADRGGSRDKHYGEREYSTYRNPNHLDYGDGRGHNSRTHFEGGSSQQNNPQHANTNSHFAPYGDSRGNYSARQDSYGQGQTNIHPDRHLTPQRRQDDSNENYYHGGYMASRGVRQELPLPEDNPYHEYPGSRSRYKDDDYRYGSGNHSWYQERRFTDNSGRRADQDKGDILGDMGEGLREAWHDMKHGVQNLWHRNTGGNRNDYTDRSNVHGENRHEQEYRSQRDHGYERGPRWSDETDSGDDSRRKYPPQSY